MFARNQAIFCPVCDAELGQTNKRLKFKMHCLECHVVYTFTPGVDKPVAQLEKDLPQGCGCGRCGR